MNKVAGFFGAVFLGLALGAAILLGSWFTNGNSEVAAWLPFAGFLITAVGVFLSAAPDEKPDADDRWFIGKRKPRTWIALAVAFVGLALASPAVLVPLGS